ncbi:acyl carrier protein [Bosea sp. ANAM02]|uniref:acyl carrier protein n=1 Tax=Bosea sp. ANAM02 TaxID=2020412 RepID=UPI002467D857|nr:acyl carrier protein [Bosea sp. ANAM02]
MDQPDRNEGRSDVVVPDDIARILVDALGVDREKVTADARLSDDLGADSLDAIEILTNIEMERDISISDTEAEAIVTVGDLASIVQMKAA